jgi:hypothetical protein
MNQKSAALLEFQIIGRAANNWHCEFKAGFKIAADYFI